MSGCQIRSGPPVTAAGRRLGRRLPLRLSSGSAEGSADVAARVQPPEAADALGQQPRCVWRRADGDLSGLPALAAERRHLLRRQQPLQFGAGAGMEFQRVQHRDAARSRADRRLAPAHQQNDQLAQRRFVTHEQHRRQVFRRRVRDDAGQPLSGQRVNKLDAPLELETLMEDLRCLAGTDERAAARPLRLDAIEDVPACRDAHFARVSALTSSLPRSRTK